MEILAAYGRLFAAANVPPDAIFLPPMCRQHVLRILMVGGRKFFGGTLAARWRQENLTQKIGVTI